MKKKKPSLKRWVLEWIKRRRAINDWLEEGQRVYRFHSENRCIYYSTTCLERCFMSLLQIFRFASLSNFEKIFKKVQYKYAFIEVYVLSFLAGFVLLLYWQPPCLFSPIPCLRPLRILGQLPLWFFIVGYRLGDILSADLGIIFIDRYNPRPRGIRSLNRSILLIGINYFEIIVGFASMYLATRSIGYSNCNNIITTPIDALYFSAVTITTLGCCDMKPISPCGMWLAAFEPIIGLIIIVVVIGAFFTFYGRR